MINGARVVVVLPAYTAERTLERTTAEVPAGVVDHFLLVDDDLQGRRLEAVERAAPLESPRPAGPAGSAPVTAA